MTTITRSQQLATTAIGIIGAMGVSGIEPGSAEFTRAVNRFISTDPVFTRAVHVRAEGDAAEGATGGEPENVEIKDGEAFSFDAVASRGTKRLMWHPAYRRIVWEVLTITPDSVDTSVVDAQNGIPFYRDHCHWSGALLGRVDRLEVTDGEVVARSIRLSKRDDVKGYRMDVADRITGGVSLGYRHKRSELIEAGENELYPTCIVHEIIPVELSATDMPADILCGIIEASIRSASTDVPDTAITGTRAADAAGITANRAANTQENQNMDPTAIGTTGANPAPVADAPVITRADQPVVQQQPGITQMNVVTFDPNAFAARSAEIYTIGQELQLDPAVVTRAIGDVSMTLDAFKLQALAAVRGRQTPGTTAGNDVATRGDRVGAMIESIVCRMNNTTPTGLATEYMRHSIRDMAEESLAAAGHVIARNDPNEVFTRTFHVTSDFGEALRGAIGRTLITIGGSRTPTYEKLSESRDLPNFLPNKAIDVDTFPVLKLVNEGGEIQYGTVGTGEFDVLLKTFALGLRITRQAFVNDGLGLFPGVVRSLSRRIPIQKNAIVYHALFIEAYKVATGKVSKALIPGKNLLPAGSTLSAENVDKAKVLMGERTLRDGTDPGITARFLVVGPKNESLAVNITTANLAALGKVNTNTELTTVVDKSIKGDSWFLLADKEEGTPALQHGSLIGNTGPMIKPWAQVSGFDGVEMEAKMDFYGAACSTYAIAGYVDADAYKAAGLVKASAEDAGLKATV
ncbi:Mu-like prophage major head subunit gpT family protein [Sphingomonas sanguinis]|uniref:Mu-like prophage major head subunit gpT family protein n=1 Tax=Sphingomonas sp. LC-1 TaxID=3110957 RepID=UPI0021BAA454|nr:Mu-like prophage major head subunit gpT family protein [Sphingomonas sp. LC-1]MCT8000572.1 Mu-like prophage major head subunit gpT family protein [Sphingomonas sp. LC-1]